MCQEIKKSFMLVYRIFHGFMQDFRSKEKSNQETKCQRRRKHDQQGNKKNEAKRSVALVDIICWHKYQKST